MLIKLFDENDVKMFEDAMMKAIVRAIRVVAKEGLISGYTPPKPETVVPDPVPTPVVSVPAFGSRMGEPQSGHPYREPMVHAFRQPETEPEDLPTPPPDKPMRSAAIMQVAKRVAKKPEGFITTQDAVQMLTGLNEHSGKTTINAWVRMKQIEAVIWCDGPMTPTKGLPGRLMVKKADVTARDKIRLANAAEMKKNGVGMFARRQNGAEAHA